MFIEMGNYITMQQKILLMKNKNTGNKKNNRVKLSPFNAAEEKRAIGGSYNESVISGDPEEKEKTGIQGSLHKDRTLTQKPQEEKAKIISDAGSEITDGEDG
jgi:hypothetical protein